MSDAMAKELMLLVASNYDRIAEHASERAESRRPPSGGDVFSRSRSGPPFGGRQEGMAIGGESRWSREALRAAAAEMVRKATLASVLSKSGPGCGLFLWLNELATRPHFAKYAMRGKAVDVAKLAYRGRIDSRITD
jgi:hypothetical protein